MSENEFILKLKEIGIVLSEQQKKQFREYASFLQHYNQKVNLTAITKIDEIYLKHFYDSIISSRYYSFSNQKILDIGTGAGFPGIPLLICFPNLKLTVLDSNNKKIKFLYELKKKIDLNYEILYDRAENITSLREKFDIVVSRAVTSLPILMELSIPYLKVNGVLISYKGKINESIDTALSKLNCTLLSSNNLFLQENDLERTFVIIKKEAETEIIYPRTYDKIKKNPL